MVFIKPTNYEMKFKYNEGECRPRLYHTDPFTKESNKQSHFQTSYDT